MCFIGIALDSIWAVSGSPIRKCPGVNAVRSLGSLESGIIGLEFKIASIPTSTVSSSSYVSEAVETLLLCKCFADLLLPTDLQNGEPWEE